MNQQISGLRDDIELHRTDVWRVQAVALTGLLDTPPEESFDSLTRLAARLTHAPLAFLSLVDAGRDFYKSCVGFDESFMALRQMEGPTFCHHALMSQGPLVINDVQDHPEYAGIPTVRSVGVRAYAGVPLVSDDGFVLGGFCVVDVRPRIWSELDIEVLTELSKSALREIKLRGALMAAQRSMRLAEEETIDKERLLASVGHDLRSPLTAMGLSFDLLCRPSSAADQKQRAMTAFRSANASIAAMLEQLFMLPAESKVARASTPTSLVNDAVLMMDPLAQSNFIKLVTRCGPGLLPLVIEYQKILRVFANLIGNAIKFSSQRSTIYIDATQQGGVTRFSVIDFGIGISPLQQTRVFDRHWQADKNDIRGAGLGLAIAKEIVEGAGGSIGVFSVLGEGSEFFFTLPSKIS